MKQANSKQIYNIKEELANKSVAVFGYGSLMYPSGINGRGMSHNYDINDLNEAILKGFKRDLSIYFLGTFFYGIYKDAGSTVNGMIFQVSIDDLIMLSKSERASPESATGVYNLYDVTDNIISDHSFDAILSFVGDVCDTSITIDNKLTYGSTKRYVSDVSRNIRKFVSEKFMEQFKKTGGIIL